MKYFKIITSICLLAASVLGIYFYLQVLQKDDTVQDLEYKFNLLQQDNNKLSAELKAKTDQIVGTQKQYYDLGKEDGMIHKELDITLGLIGTSGKFFPEDKKIIYIKCDYEKRNPIESLWVFDLKKWATHKLFDIPVGQSVMPGEEGCMLYAGSINKDGDKIIIQTHIPGDKLSNIAKEYITVF